jgi:hypothetical protein
MVDEAMARWAEEWDLNNRIWAFIGKTNPESRWAHLEPREGEAFDLQLFGTPTGGKGAVVETVSFARVPREPMLLDRTFYWSAIRESASLAWALLDRKVVAPERAFAEWPLSTLVPARITFSERAPRDAVRSDKAGPVRRILAERLSLPGSSVRGFCLLQSWLALREFEAGPGAWYGEALLEALERNPDRLEEGLLACALMAPTGSDPGVEFWMGFAEWFGSRFSASAPDPEGTARDTAFVRALLKDPGLVHANASLDRIPPGVSLETMERLLEASGLPGNLEAARKILRTSRALAPDPSAEYGPSL